MRNSCGFADSTWSSSGDGPPPVVGFLMCSAERERVREESEVRDPAICGRGCEGAPVVVCVFVGLLRSSRVTMSCSCEKKKK